MPLDIDVLLLLEGTFPYVAGGVSSWVYTLIRGFPELRFGAAFIGSRRADYGEKRYSLPDNVVLLDETYLFEDDNRPPPKPTAVAPNVIDKVRALHRQFLAKQRSPQLADAFAQVLGMLEVHDGLNYEGFLYSKAAWEMIKEFYREFCTDPSFVDYFWTIRNLHTPLWVLHRTAKRLPAARIYHSISTGYAGLLGVMLKRLKPAPFLLTEHGIYVKERKIDLFQAEWIRDNRNFFDRDPTQIAYYRQVWIRFFEVLGYVIYQEADEIIALYEANRLRQIRDGAPADRTSCIPNGINIATYAPLREQRPAHPPPVLCLIGRVVRIKDIKTFIRAVPFVLARLPEAEAWIAGPEDEDPDYAEECKDLAKQLGLAAKVRFLGFQRLVELLPKIGLLVLSSISEALPLVVLEAFAAGVPAVCTDVGSCRQLIEGLPGADAALGRAGRIVRIADPTGLANAAVELLSNPLAWQEASNAAIRRVETYYVEHMMFDRYRQLYQKHGLWQA